MRCDRQRDANNRQGLLRAHCFDAPLARSVTSCRLLNHK
jgi:hypothetical protein